MSARCSAGVHRPLSWLQGGAGVHSTPRANVLWPRCCPGKRLRMRPRSRSRGDLAVTVSAERPRLVLPGLIPADPRLERYRVHPGAVTARSPSDRLLGLILSRLREQLRHDSGRCIPGLHPAEITPDTWLAEGEQTAVIGTSSAARAHPGRFSPPFRARPAISRRSARSTWAGLGLIQVDESPARSYCRLRGAAVGAARATTALRPRRPPRLVSCHDTGFTFRESTACSGCRSRRPPPARAAAAEPGQPSRPEDQP